MKKGNFIDFILNHRNVKYIMNNTERIHVISIFFLLSAFIIIWKMFSYTVFDFDFYKKLADKQQIGSTVVPVNRGNILSSGNEEKVLATSLNLYDISIDPQMVGDKSKLGIFLIDLVYRQICYNKTSSDCKNNLTKYLRVLELEEFENTEEFVKKALKENIDNKVLKTKVTSVFFDNELTEEQINKIIHLGIKGLYPTGKFLYANPEEISDINQVSNSLSSIIGYDVDDLKNMLRKRDLRYIPIINKSSIHVSEYLKKYISEEKNAIKKGILDSKKSISNFFILEPQPNRFYPENSLGAQVIGFVDNEGEGHYGIEGYYNGILRGNNGKIISRKDISGRIIDPISLNSDEITGEGVTVITTIDRNIQRKAEEVLEKGVKAYRANKGKVIIMDPNTGKILAMANYPTYDLNNFGDVYDLEKVRYSKYPNPTIDLLGYPIFVEDNELGEKMIYDGKEIYLRLAEREELGNMALVKYKFKNDYGAGVYKNDIISSLYEAGSIIKPLTVAIGIDTGEINRNSMYQDNGYLTIDTFKITNVSNNCLGYNSFQNALNWSCNVGMIRIVQRIGKVVFHQYLEDFGIGINTGVELSGEVSSKMEPWERWSMAGLLTRSYGLGMSVTQLQVANAYNILANGGTYVKPRIIEKIIYANGKEEVFKTEKQRRVIKESTSDIMKEMMYDGTHDGRGFGEVGAIDGYRFALKSGTAQIPFRGGYETGAASTIGSFAGFGPIEDPKFTMIVTLDRPRSSVYGGSTSALIFKELAQYLVDYYGIPKRDYKFNNFDKSN